MPVPRDEMDMLLDVVIRFAQHELDKRGEFFPFAAAIDSSGELQMVAVELDDDHPPSSAVLDALYDRLSSSAAGGEIRAAGICVDVRVRPPRSSTKTDAISVAVEHANANPVEVFLPYRKRMRGFEYGELFAQAADARIFRVE